MILVSLGLILLALFGAPLFAVIAASAMWGFSQEEIDLSVMAIEIFGLAEMPILLAIPLFTFAGYLLSESGAPARLVRLTEALLGWLPGGLAIVALAAMVPRALAAAERLQSEEGISASVVDLRSLVPLDTTTIFDEIGKTGRLVTVEENPRLCGWGAEISSIVAEERFWDLDMPIIRITTPHIPLPSADELEDLALPSVDRIFETVRNEVD